MSQEEIYINLLKAVQRYYPYSEIKSTEQVSEREMIVRQNGKNIQLWQEWSINYIEQVKVQSFLDQIRSILSLSPIVIQYLKMVPQSVVVLKNIQGIQINPDKTQTQAFQQFYKVTKGRIILNLDNSSNISEFLKKEINHIIDILQRRCKLVTYYNLLVEQSGKRPIFSKKFGDMTFVDFIIILQKISQPSDIITFLLGQQNAPLPIRFSAIEKQVNNADLLVNLLHFNNYPLILNIWSENQKKRGIDIKIAQNKQILFGKILGINTLYFGGSHFGNAINLYVLNINNQKVLMADYIENNINQERPYMLKLFQKARIAIFHLHDQDFIQKKNNLFFMKKYLNLNQQLKIKIFCDQFHTLIPQIQSRLKGKIQFNINSNDIFRFTKNPTAYSIQGFIKMLEAQTSPKGTFNYNIQLVHFTQDQILAKKTIYDSISEFLRYQLNVSKKEQLLPKVCLSTELNKVRTQIKKLDLQKIQEKNITRNQLLKLQLKRQEKQKTTSFITQQPKQTLQIIEESRKQYIVELNRLIQREEDLKNKLTQVYMPPFVQQCKKYIKQEGNIEYQDFNYCLTNQSNKKIRQKLILLNPNIIDQQIKKTQDYKQKKQEIMQSRITIDNIFYEYNIYNELTIDRNNQTLYSFEQKYINQYYSKCLKSQTPFNVVDGESSTFGSKSLQRFFEQLKIEEKGKQIFVISVIGPKSSGKSTLINYLFHYNIHMREDQFARGIYVGSCQINNKIIVLLDTAGIMELDNTNYKEGTEYTAQQLGTIFATFDHQIASLVMKVSDLVIFSGFANQTSAQLIKKIIPGQLQLAVAVCYKVLDAIHTNNDDISKKKVVPKRIMFALSKTNKQDIINKRQAISQMMNNLKPILLLQNQSQYKDDQSLKILFEKYIRLQPQDIFQLPTIYEDKKSIFLHLNEAYGMNIILFRTKILAHLEAIGKYRLQSRLITAFYNESESNWDILMLTGSNILRAKSLKESYSRGYIFKIYHQEYSNIYTTLSKYIDTMDFNELDFVESQIQDQVSTRQQKKQQTPIYATWSIFQTKLNPFLDKIYQKDQILSPSKYQIIIQNTIKYFKSLVQKQIDTTKYADLYILSIKKLFDALFINRIKQKFNTFENQFKVAMTLYYKRQIYKSLRKLNFSQRINKQDRQTIYNQETKRFLNSSHFQPPKQQTIQIDLRVLFSNIFASENIFLKELEIKSINDCLNLFQRIRQNYIRNLNQLIVFENQGQIQQKFRAEIAQNIEQSIKNVEIGVRGTFSLEGKKFIPNDISNNFAFIKGKIDEATRNLQNDISLISQKVYTENNLLKNKSTSINQFVSGVKTEVKAKISEIKKKISPSQDANTQIVVQTQQQIDKLNYEKNYLQRQAIYLDTISSSITDLVSRLSLGQINFKIIVIAKVFKILQELIYNQAVEHTKQMKQQYRKSIQANRQGIISYFDTSFDKFNSSILGDFNTNKKKWIEKFKLNLTDEYKDQVKRSLKDRNKVKMLDSIQLMTLEDTSFDYSNPNTFGNNPKDLLLQIKQHYIQCYKYIVNPKKFLIQRLYSVVGNMNQINSIITNAYNKVDFLKNKTQLDSTASLVQIKAFLKDNSLIQIQSFIANQQKQQNSNFFTAQELIFQYQQMVKNNSQQLKAQITKLADTQLIIQYINSEIQKMQDNFVGCTECCPLCGAMCQMQSKHMGVHSAIHHILAFAGCRDMNNRPLLRNCTSNMKNQHWFKDQPYENVLKMITGKYPGWKDSFTTLDSAIQQNESDTKYLKIWANIQRVMLLMFSKRYTYNVQLRTSINQKVLLEKQGNQLTIQDIANYKLQDYWK